MLDDSTTNRKRRLVYVAAFAGALLLHFGVGVALGSVRPSIAHAVDQALAPVEFTPIEPEPAPEPEPEPLVEALPEPAPVVERQRPTAPRPDEPPPPEPAAPPPPAAETPIDFSNTMVLSNGPSSFAVQQSSGVEADRIGRPGAQVTGRSREGVEGGTPGGTGEGPPRPIPASDLSEQPRPPSELDSVLRRLYPTEAQAQGIEARVTARFVILADGRPTAIRIGRESVEGFGFGAACRRAIETAGRWSAPIGPDGRPTSTSFSMSCSFDIR